MTSAVINRGEMKEEKQALHDFDNVVRVKELTKRYPKFTLNSVSFTMKKGRIMGLIGRNGAGKSTTLKSMLHMVHPDSGEVECFGLDMEQEEAQIKQRIGFAGGAVDYYRKKKIGQILEITKRFYENWDETLCEKYRALFNIDIDKTPSELSEGMKVKLNLIMALSHKAELLILDEPTSGLDPVSREELLEIFLYLKKQGVSILFSTHITSDLEKCADDITYIREGKVVYTGEKSQFLSLEKEKGNTLEDIMVSYEKEALHEKFDL